MSDFCSRIVSVAGEWWTYLGWGPFLLWLFLPVLARGAEAAVLVVTLSFWIWILWLIIDSTDQQVAIWQKAVGICMLGMGLFLPYGQLFMIISFWVIYWMKVRE